MVYYNLGFIFEAPAVVPTSYDNFVLTKADADISERRPTGQETTGMQYLGMWFPSDTERYQSQNHRYQHFLFLKVVMYSHDWAICHDYLANTLIIGYL